MKKKYVIVFISAVSLLLLFTPAVAGAGTANCDTIMDEIAKGTNEKEGICLAISKGYNVYLVFKCAIAKGIGLGNIIRGAIAAGVTQDVIAKYAIKAEAGPEEVALYYLHLLPPELAYDLPFHEPYAELSPSSFY